jgi:hypothetical protein
MVYTFASSDPGVQSLVLTVTCASFFAWHQAVVPLRSQQSQTLQTVLQFCLVGVALSELPFTIELEKGVAPVAARATFRSDDLGHRMQTAFRVVVPALAVAWTYFAEWAFGRTTKAEGCGVQLRQVLHRWRHRQSLRLAKAAGVGSL